MHLEQLLEISMINYNLMIELCFSHFNESKS